MTWLSSLTLESIGTGPSTAWQCRGGGRGLISRPLLILGIGDPGVWSAGYSPCLPGHFYGCLLPFSLTCWYILSTCWDILLFCFRHFYQLLAWTPVDFCTYLWALMCPSDGTSKALGPCPHPILLLLRYGNLLLDHTPSMAARRIQLKGAGCATLARGRPFLSWEKQHCSVLLGVHLFQESWWDTFLLKSEPILCVLLSNQSQIFEAEIKCLIFGCKSVFIFIFIFKGWGNLTENSSTGLEIGRG